MSDPKISSVSKRSANSFYIIAITLLVFRICSYFMLSEEVAITQLLKIVLRISVTFATGVLLSKHIVNSKKEELSITSKITKDKALLT